MLIRTHNLAMLTEAKIRNAKPRDGPTLQQARSLFEIRVWRSYGFSCEH